MQPVPLYLLMLVIICFPIWVWLALIRRANKKDEKGISETEHLLPKDISEPVITLIKLMESNKVYFEFEPKHHKLYQEKIKTFCFYDPSKNYRFELYIRIERLDFRLIEPESSCAWMTKDEMEAICKAADDIGRDKLMKKQAAERQSVVDMYATKESDNV